ncbi:YibE/F family protein [Couchioplanes azureus]|uniref:YibE/F family protein n=1 Tax=Couchioplanes caeruleus TaxID=56438 RepID=UPI00198944F3|nr:YibE/F family protein [Couchioplanes caeruleus]GGQ77197.1 hypothetical protein GCM10010166_53930 [Couchioplanes caeruleus subsp. azureus]
MTVKLASGPDTGTTVTTDIPAGPGAVQVTAGDDAVLLMLQKPDGGGVTYSISDFQRSTQLWLLTVTRSATVRELARANPKYRFRQLYGAATRIGRAHIASVVNTIVLAYAGASLPLMLLFAVGNTPAGELLTGQLIAQELVRAAVGTIGLIAGVPITTALAALVAARTSHPEKLSDVDSDGVVRPAAASRASPRPADDPWAAFVERHPGWQEKETPQIPGASSSDAASEQVGAHRTGCAPHLCTSAPRNQTRRRTT